MAELDMTVEERDAFLAEVHVGVLAIARSDKGPLAVPIWYQYEDGLIVLGMSRTSLKATLLRRAGRATLTVQLETAPYKYVSVEGPVSFSDDVRDVLGVATRYLGPDVGRAYAANNPPNEDSVVVRLTPAHWITADFGKVMG